MAPIVPDALAGARRQDLRREAEQWRVARLARPRTSGRTQPGRVAAAVTALAAGLAAGVLEPRNGTARAAGRPGPAPGFARHCRPAMDEPDPADPALLLDGLVLRL